MARVPDEKPARPRRRFPRAIERPTRIAFLVALVILASLPPEVWVRSVAVAVALGIFYAAGWSDGRRDALIGWVGGRDARSPRRAVRAGEDAA